MSGRRPISQRIKNAGGNADFLLREMVDGLEAADEAAVSRTLALSPQLAIAAFQAGATRQSAKKYYLEKLGRYIFAGDTALHIAAAAYRPDFVRTLIAAGADVRARNRRGAEPLHAAAVGNPGSPRWDPGAQAATIAVLIAAGADPNATDKSGVTPLHRAVRTRCAAAVRALLDHGADAALKNGSGSSPLLLAKYDTGRGGTGSPEAREQQRQIIELLREYGGK